MTEDDTFERLRRLPLVATYNEWMKSPVEWDSDESIVWFRSKGWDRDDWYNKFLIYRDEERNRK